MSDFQTKWKTGFFTGVTQGWRSFIWIGRIIIPVSFLVTLLQWTGWLNQLDALLNPLMNLIKLPSEAALPIISGMLINLYAGIAVMTALPFTLEQMTLMAVFSLICHNLIAEGIIQHKSGINVIKATLVRIVAAVLAVLIVSLFLGDTSQSIAVAAAPIAPSPLLEVLKGWTINLAGLLLKILGIVMTIMIMLEFSASLKWGEYSLRLFRPLLRIFRLSERTATLWLTSVTFGLMYGGAVIINEAKKGNLSKEELESLHISIGINHAMVEDPALFLALGLNPFWLWIPKLVMAIIAVQTYRVIIYLKNRLLH
ncbi:MAG: iron transporter [Chloroflexi bacterium]|nr:iron transporter [Chloroflexota bacterium]